MSPDPSSEPKRWDGTMQVISVFCGGVLGYRLAKVFLLEPSAEAAAASGKSLPWEPMAQWAATGSIAGALFFSVLIIADEKLREWRRINRRRKQTERDFSRLFEEKNK
jgi:hypothetical protein